MNKNKIALAILASSIGLVGCAATIDAPAPAPAAERTIPVAPTTPRVEEDILLDAMEVYWYGQPVEDQVMACNIAMDYPDLAWEAFDNGAEGAFERTTFESLVARVC
jgi:hypothetical protein